jgi:membrane protein required for colicin V production
MLAAAATQTASSYNWYDVVVIIALAYGVWSGIRTGLTGELIRAAGWVLTVTLAVRFYQPVGQWLSGKLNMETEVGHLVAFIAIALGMYAVQVMVRTLVHKRVKRFKFGAVLENVGGGTAGAVRMALVMTCLSVMLCLIRSPFWHQQVGKNSAFGSYVTGRFPAVAAMVEKKFPETMWFSKELKRPDDPGIPEDKLKKP